MKPRSITHRLSNACLLAGAGLLATYGLATVYGRVSARLSVQRFQATHAETLAFAPGRVLAYKRALTVALPQPKAVLRIPSAQIEVPVLDGTSDTAMDRGAGHLNGSAAVGTDGNIVLASHRDGFFRHLKDVQLGDRVEIARNGGTDVYRVDGLRVVERGDMRMVRWNGKPTVTLVTCYPFFFIGAAPQRFVVTASLVENKL